MTKPFWQSKTLWFNFLVVVLGFFNNQVGSFGLSAQTQIFAVAIINFVLRFVTSKSVSAV